MLVRKKLWGQYGRGHKLAPAIEDPFWVLLVKDTTVVVKLRDGQEQVSRDRVVEAPSAAELIKEGVIQIEKNRNHSERGWHLRQNEAQQQTEIKPSTG